MKDNKYFPLSEQFKKYHTVGTVAKSNRNITWLERFQSPIEKITQRQSIQQAHIYMTARFSSLKQGF